MHAKHTGAVILGGGVVKHHIMNANLMRNGTDHCVYINTGQEVCAMTVLSVPLTHSVSVGLLHSTFRFLQCAVHTELTRCCSLTAVTVALALMRLLAGERFA